MINLESIRTGQYIVVQRKKEDGTSLKPEMIRVTSIRNDDLTVVGRLEKDPHLAPATIIAGQNEILVNLGKRPHPGKVYGYNLEKIFRGTQQHDDFGDIHYFTKPDEAAIEAFSKGMNKASRVLNSAGLSFVLKKGNFVIEVMPKLGKYAGMYMHVNPEKDTPRIQLVISKETVEKSSIPNYTYVVLHEFAHLIDFQFLSSFHELNSKWLNLFSTSIGPRSVSKEKADELLKRLIKSGLGFKGFYSELDEDDRSDMRLLVKWIREIKGIQPNDIKALLESKSDMSMATLKNIWPTVNVRSKKLLPIVSEYACKNRRELFAESLSFYLLGKELPKKIVSLVEDSISKARSYSKTL